jgi:hypothetical protein
MTQTHEQLAEGVQRVRNAAPFCDPPIVGQVLAEVLDAILVLHEPPPCEAHCDYPCSHLAVVEKALADLKDPSMSVARRLAVQQGHRKISSFGDTFCSCGYDGWPCEA